MTKQSLSAFPRTITVILFLVLVSFLFSCSDKAVGSGSTCNPFIPRLIAFGAEDCAECDSMREILNQLRQDYDTRLLVEYIDIKKYPVDARTYRVSDVPVWIFVASKGEELFRYRGVLDAKAIVQQWEKLDYVFHPGDKK